MANQLEREMRIEHVHTISLFTITFRVDISCRIKQQAGATVSTLGKYLAVFLTSLQTTMMKSIKYEPVEHESRCNQHLHKIAGLALTFKADIYCECNVSTHISLWEYSSLDKKQCSKLALHNLHLLFYHGVLPPDMSVVFR